MNFFTTKELKRAVIDCFLKPILRQSAMIVTQLIKRTIRAVKRTVTRGEKG